MDCAHFAEKELALLIVKDLYLKLKINFLNFDTPSLCRV